MEKVVKLKESFIQSLPAVSHYDSTARLQTIPSNSELIIAEILKLMREKGLLPVLINTSFNLNGEPNVETIPDAVRTFYTSGLDALAIAPSYLVTK